MVTHIDHRIDPRRNTIRFMRRVLIKKLTILLIFSLIPAMSFSEGRIFQDEECRRDKPFIDFL